MKKKVETCPNSYHMSLLSSLWASFKTSIAEHRCQRLDWEEKLRFSLGMHDDRRRVRHCREEPGELWRPDIGFVVEKHVYSTVEEIIRFEEPYSLVENHVFFYSYFFICILTSYKTMQLLLVEP